MQQRLGLARAILHQPDILLFDEPYTGLDVAGSVLLDTVIREQHAAGRTLIFTSHDLGRLAGVATALAVLQKGRLVYQGALPTDESVESAYQRLIGAP
jgi:ABC-type multidrug transport system ATPase subunit